MSDLKRSLSIFLNLTQFFGGGDQIRTDDPMLAEHVLSQLSYTPLFIAHIQVTSFGGGKRVRTDDLMLAKHALSQLSYTPSYIPPLLPFFGGPGRT